MAQTGDQLNYDLYLQDGFWRLRWHGDDRDANGAGERNQRRPEWIGPATGPERLTRTEAERIVRENLLPRSGPSADAGQAVMTVAEFVETVFVPEHVAVKKLAGRTHYRAILQRVLTPKEVDRAFHVEPGKSTTRLDAFPNWPYLDKVRLCDVQPIDVQRLVAAALARGYSTQTVKHIRNVVRAIFALATKKGSFTGDNPANPVTLPEMTRTEAHALTLAQVKRVLAVMQYPEKEMALLAILTRMNMAEICGLQWKYVNLTETWLGTDGEPIPPKTIAVRRQWYRGELLEPHWKIRNRNLPISDLLFPMLLGLSQRAKYAGPDDFVLVSPAGTPISEHYIAARRLKPIGKALQMPWLSWRVFRRTRASLLNELELQCHELGIRRPEDTLRVKEPVKHPVSGTEERTDSIWTHFRSWASRVVWGPEGTNGWS
jgi:integrase